MLSYSAGHSIDYLTDAVAAGRESYYTGAVAAGEPPGRWWGEGATALGLSGLVDNAVISDLYGKFLDPRDGESVLGHGGRRYATPEELFARKLAANPHASAEERERLRMLAEKEVRGNVAFHDTTFSPPKSVTVLHAAFEAQEVAARRAGNTEAEQAWAAYRLAVETAVWKGNNACLAHLQEHAGYTRVGKHSGTAGRWADAHGWTVASFFQHDSRNHDPQLHIHNAVLNRVQGPDGKWRTIDWEVAKLRKAAAGAVGERVMFETLVASIGVQVAMRPDGVTREIKGVDQRVMDLFSSRRTEAITPKLAQLVAEFETRFGREPNSLELHRLSQRATLATRPAKEHAGESAEERLDRWDRELRAEVAGGLADVAWAALKWTDRERPAQVFDPTLVARAALAEVQASRAKWTESDLIRAVDRALPDYLGGLDAGQVTELVGGIAAHAIAAHCERLTADAPGAGTLPAAERLANGMSAQQRPHETYYATREHARTERVLRAAAVERGAVAITPELAGLFVCELAELGTELGAAQAAAVRGVLSSGAQLESLVGPAGTGKTRTVGALAKAWRDPDLWGGQPRRVFGLATAQIATDVLAGEGLTARNTRAWLAAQQRLAEGRGIVEDQTLCLREGDLVVVDESSMADTTDLAAIREHAQAAGAKLLLTGDHRQLAAVGAGGAMNMVAATGITYELTEVRRFTNEWEKAASLRLREGDTDALLEYRKHGRIIDAGTYAQATDRAIQGYLADTIRGVDTRLLVDTNDQAAVVSAKVRAELVALGQVQETGLSLKQGTTAGVGDLVEARRLAWDLAGYEGNRRGPVTREQYRVLSVREDGGLDVAHVVGRGVAGEQHGDRLTLPAEYVANDLALGYACTAYSVEGVTVDTCHSIATSHTGRASHYVGMTRGRASNTTYVQTVADTTDSQPGRTIERRDPLAVLDRSADDGAADRAAVVEAEESARHMGSVQTAAERLAEVSERRSAGRTASMLDQLLDRDVLSEAQREALAADENTPALARVLRQAEVAGHDPLHVLTNAITERELGSARSLASVLHERISSRVDLEPVGDLYRDWVPKVTDPAYQTHLNDLAQAADDRRDELGAQIALDAPQWAVEALGAVPADPDALTEWVQRAGVVAAHREWTGHTDDATALPAAPPVTRVEQYASWRASWRALGRPEDTRAEAEMSDGQLLVRVRALAREDAWAPPYVARDLAGATQAATEWRDRADLLAFRAQHTHDPAERTQLQQQAAAAAKRTTELEAHVTRLDENDTARAEYYLRTAPTRAAAELARVELARRDIDPDSRANAATAEEWLTAWREGQAQEEAYLPVTGADVEDNTLDRDGAIGAELDVMVETAVPDIREIAAVEQPLVENVDDWERLPTEDTTRAAVEAAHRALEEIRQRDEWEAAREAEDRVAQTAMWAAADQLRADADADELVHG